MRQLSTDSVDSGDKLFCTGRNVPILCAVTRGNVLAALVLSALLGCSDPKAGTLPTASSASSSSPVTPPPSPSATTASAQVEAAVRAYYAAMEAAVHEPARHTDTLAKLIDPACACHQIVDVLRDEAKKGRHADYTLTVKRIAVPDASPSRGTATVTVAQSSGSLYDSSGRVVDKVAASTSTYFLELRNHSGQWRVARVTEQ